MLKLTNTKEFALSPTENRPSLQDQLKLEYISRSVYGPIFYIVLTGICIVTLNGPSNYHAAWLIGLVGVFLISSVRHLYFHYFVRNTGREFDFYQTLAILTVVIHIFFAVPLWASMLDHDLLGEGVIFFVIYIAVTAGIAFSQTPILWLQRVSILTIFAGIAAGLIPIYFETHEVKLLLLATLAAIYFLVIGKKQHIDMKLLLTQQEQIRRDQDRIRRDLAAAKEIQRSLLPAIQHEFSGTSLEILYRPCEELSGDFFEIFQHGRSIIFYVADVTSHGTASAQVTFLLKGIFKNLIATLGSDVDIAAFTKKMALEYVGYKLEYAVSLVVAVYDLDTGKLNYVSSAFPELVTTAGQDLNVLRPPVNPYIISGQLTDIEKFTPSEFILRRGESLFLFTDGAYEFLDSRKQRQFGASQFTRLLKNSQGTGWSAQLLEELQTANQSADFEDDITVMRLQRD